jgi:hypothetical protein
MNQTINGWELLIGGDCCPNINALLESGYFEELSRICEERGNKLVVYNLATNHKGFGYAITNENIKRATGEYFIFFANDDMLKPNHFDNYLTPMESDKSVDMGLFKNFNEPFGGEMNPIMRFGDINHSHLIVKTSVAQSVPPHTPNYDHDWVFINSIVDRRANVKYFHNPSTYIVKSVPNKLEVGID